MTREIGALSVLSLLLGSTLLLSSLRILNRRDQFDRVTDHRNGPGSDPRDPVDRVTEPVRDFISSLALKLTHSANGLLAPMVQVDPSTLITKTDLAIAIVAMTAAGVLTRSLAAALSALVLIPLAISLIRLASLAAEAKKQTQWLRYTLADFIEQLSAFVSSGLSFPAAVDRFARLGTDPWKPYARSMSAEIRRGRNPGDALMKTFEENRLKSMAQLPRLISGHYGSPELPALLDEQCRWLRMTKRLELIATLEKRAQSVWIPVTVAALVPGIIFVMIPFIGALHTFGQL